MLRRGAVLDTVRRSALRALSLRPVTTVSVYDCIRVPAGRLLHRWASARPAPRRVLSWPAGGVAAMATDDPSGVTAPTGAAPPAADQAAAAAYFGRRTAGKGTTSGYVPFGFAAASGPIHDAIVEGGGFVHGFTWSHHALGAAAGLAVLRELKAGLVDRSRELGERLGKSRAPPVGSPSAGAYRKAASILDADRARPPVR